MKKHFKIFGGQYSVNIFIVLTVSVLCYLFKDQINYRIAALILLLTVSVIAMISDILPVLLSAILSALIWNYFFIEPAFTLDISSTEDLLFFLSYFFVALLNGVLTYKIKKVEKKARDKDEKEKTIKLYNTLLNSLSHELKTPISAIVGTVDTLKENSDILSNEQIIDLYNDIEIASIRLNRQVENILNMSRLESGMLQPKKDWCDVNELVFSAIQRVNLSQTHIVKFDYKENFPLVKTDRGFLDQILMNLLHNAVKYTDNGCVIEVETQFSEEKLYIIIKDNGEGIPENETTNVFEKFKRLSGKGVIGSGLGLSIVKGFAEAQGGSVNLTCNENKGCCFTVCIPAEFSYLNSLKNE